MEQVRISSSLEENMEQFHRLFRVDKNFDVVYRTMKIGGRRACFYFVDGFVRDEVLQRIIQYMCGVSGEDFPKEAHEFSKKHLPYGEIGVVKDAEQLLVILEISGGVCVPTGENPLRFIKVSGCRVRGGYN